MITGFEGLVALLRMYFRQDVPRGGMLTRLRWFQWGYIGDDAWYILIMLPSYQMRTPAVYPPGSRIRWHQLSLMFLGELPAGLEEWKFNWMEIPPQGVSHE